MDIFECYNAECALMMDKLNHIWESSYDTFFIQCEDIHNSSVVEENVKELMFEASVSDVGKKVVEVIQKIIDTIKDFCSKVKEAIIDRFTSKEAKDKLKEVEDAIQKNPEKGKEKVKVYDDVKAKAKLDTYIQEMAKLERKLMNIKIQATDNFKMGNKKDAALVISANQILREMDILNSKYDKDLLDINEEVIEMALKDAIRFSDKQLSNVRVDYDAVEKKSEQVLAEFKKDANGCDVPVKYNAIQKMANAIGTRARKFIQRRTEIRKKNMALIFGTAAISLGITAWTQYKNNPAVKQPVDRIIAQVKNARNGNEGDASQGSKAPANT